MTEAQLKAIAPNLKIEHGVIMDLFAKYDINTPARIAGFFAQCGHESGDFKFKAENLNYSAAGLVKIFKKYFPSEAAAAGYARNPEKIANKVYGGRMGNGPEASGDGWKFRGRGYIQLTGKNNYTAFANDIGKSIDETIEYLNTDAGALESALHYWKKANCNKYCDSNDQKGLCKSINGGFNHLEDRVNRFNKALKILNG